MPVSGRNIPVSFRRSEPESRQWRMRRILSGKMISRTGNSLLRTWRCGENERKRSDRCEADNPPIFPYCLGLCSERKKAGELLTLLRRLNEQNGQKIAGERHVRDRTVSLSAPDMRPIKKGKNHPAAN
jgi:hypothetical protein